MCGIAGIIGLRESESNLIIDKMIQSMKHRGPDAQKKYVDSSIALGHVRLSIIDLSNGADQPFEDITHRYVIVFNGEIYNYKSLKQIIDYKWTSESDTEVILAAYIKWGKDCLAYLNGMFAFAIWDKQSGELFIARDRLGVKPFYYYLDNDKFIFASEIRSLLSTELVPRELDPDSLSEYLSFMSIPTPNSIIKDVYQLKPGHYGSFENGRLEIHKYWSMLQPNDEINNKSHSELVEQIKQLFEQSIESRMVADVKVGTFLSGGIDSSAVVATMSKYSKTPVETFSIVFDDQAFDESTYSRLIAEKYKTKHTEFLLEPQELIKNLPEYIQSMDTPTVDGINTFMVSKLVANTGIKVVLTGIGGDELFAGYNGFFRWKKFKKASFIVHIPGIKHFIQLISKLMKSRAIEKIADLFKRQESLLSAFYLNSRSIFFKHEIQGILNVPVRLRPNWVDLDAHVVKNFPAFSQYSYAEFTNYTLDVLMKDTDQMSMAWALEVREPFFDYKMIEYVLNISDNEKYSKTTPKRLLVEAMGDLLPPEIVYRPKKGFTFPWNNWLKSDLKEYCELSIKSLSQRAIFKKQGVLNLWQDFIQNKGTVTWMHIWSLVILEKWLKENRIN